MNELTITLPNAQAAELLAKAQAAGVTVSEFLQRAIEIAENAAKADDMTLSEYIWRSRGQANAEAMAKAAGMTVSEWVGDVIRMTSASYEANGSSFDEVMRWQREHNIANAKAAGMPVGEWIARLHDMLDTEAKARGVNVFEYMRRRGAALPEVGAKAAGMTVKEYLRMVAVKAKAEGITSADWLMRSMDKCDAERFLRKLKCRGEWSGGPLSNHEQVVGRDDRRDGGL